MKSHLKKWWAIWVGLCVLAVVVCLYFVTFHRGLSPNQNVWADFGNYVGGVAGPILTFLTVVLVLQTLHVQREELKLSRDELALTRDELRKSSEALARQARQFADKDLKDDLFRRADAVFEEIKERRTRKVSRPWTRIGETYRKIAVEPEKRTAFDQLFLSEHKLALVALANEKTEEAAYVWKHVEPMFDRLLELRDYLSHIDKLSGGSTRATDFYRRREQEFVRALHEKGYIPTELMSSFDTLPIS
jgi:uncharacterized membrane protein